MAQAAQEAAKIENAKLRAVKRHLELLHGVADIWRPGTHPVDDALQERSIDDAPVHGSPLLYRSCLADLRFTIRAQFARKERVVTRWAVTGTHTGELLGFEPTGREVSFDGATVSAISGEPMKLTAREDRVIETWIYWVTEEWSYWDVPQLVSQLR